jgi:hypothetical protein
VEIYPSRQSFSAQQKSEEHAITAGHPPMKDPTVDKDKFDAVLRRMTQMKPMTVKELSAKLKAEKAAKVELVQKMDKPDPQPKPRDTGY